MRLTRAPGFTIRKRTQAAVELAEAVCGRLGVTLTALRRHSTDKHTHKCRVVLARFLFKQDCDRSTIGRVLHRDPKTINYYVSAKERARSRAAATKAVREGRALTKRIEV